MKPKLVFATMAGIATSLALFALLGGGTVATPSPGSVVMMIALSPSSALLANLAGFLGGMIVSFLIGGLLLGRDGPGKEGSEEAAFRQGELGEHGALAHVVGLTGGPVNTIVVACDAGMGSSAMGASTLRTKLRQSNLAAEVRNSKIEAIPPGVDLIVTHTQLSERAKQLHKDGRTRFMTITNFVEADQYDEIVDYVRRANVATPGLVTVMPQEEPSQLSPEVLTVGNVQLDCRFVSKEEAIEAAGRILVREGYVEAGYIDSMQEREKLLSVYVGNHVAIPHGSQGSDELIIRSGVSIVQVPDGVRFDDQVAYILFGIAGKADAHLGILSRIAKFVSDPANVDRLRAARSREALVGMIMDG